MAETTGQEAGEGTGQPPGQLGRSRSAHRRVAQWLRDYVRLQDIPDEYIGQDGLPRAVWTRFFEHFASLAPAKLGSEAL